MSKIIRTPTRAEGVDQMHVAEVEAVPQVGAVGRQIGLGGGGTRVALGPVLLRVGDILLAVAQIRGG